MVDEAHRMRNVASKLLECMRSVVAKGLSAYGYQHRVLMTGTPLQNNTSELWALLNFVEPAKVRQCYRMDAWARSCLSVLQSHSHHHCHHHRHRHHYYHLLHRLSCNVFLTDLFAAG